MKYISVIIITISILLAGCGTRKVIDGKEYGTVGLFTKDKMADDIEYDIIVGNVIWGVILIETAAFPVYFFGFSMYEPVGKKQLTQESE